MLTPHTILGPDGQPLRSVLDNLEDPRLDLHDPKTWEGVLGETKSGVKVSPFSALGYPPLWRALNLISGDVGRLPLSTFRRMDDGGKEKAREHPAYRLVRRKANPVMRASAFKRAMTYQALFRGNGVAAIVHDNGGRPRQLLMLDPTQTALAIVDGEMWYVTTVAGQDGPEQLRLPPTEVFHIKGLSNNGLWGLDVFDVMREALGMPIAAREYTSRFFGSGSNQSGVLMVPATFTDDKIKSTLKAWNEIATGLSKAHKVSLLRENVKWIPTTVTPKDSETTGLLEHEILMVSAITGAPPHKLGSTSRTSYNSLESENHAYLDDCLDPWLHEWEEESDAKLLSEREQESEEYFHAFNRNARLRMDAKARGEFYTKLRQSGAFTANDILRREDLPTIPGPEGERRFVPSNWQPLESAAGSREQGAGNREREQRNREQRNAHRKLVNGILNGKAKIERGKVLKAAERAAAGKLNLVDWLDQFYAEHQVRVLAALEDARRVIQGERSSRKPWAQAIAHVCKAHLTDLLEACGRVTRDGLVDEIQRVVDGWNHRKLVLRLVPQPTKGRGRSNAEEETDPGQ